TEKAVDNIKTEFEELFLCKHNKNINYIEILKIK
ncbi:MAG: tRNA (guanosine(46)-N7)-methyltransferase TrmB, partial [Fusobacteriaceae bacterium]